MQNTYFSGQLAWRLWRKLYCKSSLWRNVFSCTITIFYWKSAYNKNKNKTRWYWVKKETLILWHATLDSWFFILNVPFIWSCFPLSVACSLFILQRQELDIIIAYRFLSNIRNNRRVGLRLCQQLVSATDSGCTYERKERHNFFYLIIVVMCPDKTTLRACPNVWRKAISNWHILRFFS